MYRNPDLALQVKYNRARKGELKVGEKAPDVNVYGLNGLEGSLMPIGGKPVFLMAGECIAVGLRYS